MMGKKGIECPEFKMGTTLVRACKRAKDLTREKKQGVYTTPEGEGKKGQVEMFPKKTESAAQRWGHQATQSTLKKLGGA